MARAIITVGPIGSKTAVKPQSAGQRAQKHAPTTQGADRAVLTVQRRQPTTSHVFVCAEESDFYSLAIERLLLGEHRPRRVIEFGSGDGKPVLDCLERIGRFDGVIYGYELVEAAAKLAQGRAKDLGVQDTYQVRHSCFYKGAEIAKADCLIANPPYIPSPDDDILMPSLRGGIDGSGITKHLLTLGYERCLLVVSAYSDPIGTLEHAREHGYTVADYTATPMPFGTYSSEPKVRQWIRHLEKQGKAYCSPDSYILTCILFERRERQRDGQEWTPLEQQLIKVFTNTSRVC